MVSAKGLRSLCVAAGALAVLTASCASGGATALASPAMQASTTTTTPEAETAPFSLPDVTARPITSTDLIVMLPAGKSSIVANADHITLTVADPEDAAADVLAFGRVTGVATAMETEAGLAHVWIDLLGDDDLAHGYLLDTAGDIVKRMGGTYSPDVAAISAEEFPITVGEEAIGLLIELDDTYESAVVYRLGRLVIYVGLEHATGADLRVPLQYLADQVEESAIAALLANTVAEESVVKPSYRFETSITAEALSGSWLVERTGNFHGDDLSCTVRTVDPQGDRVVEVRAIDGTVAMASGDGRFATVGAGNLEARTLLASCESWPLDAVAAGMEPLMGATTTRHHVNGVNALGFTPEPSALAAILGIGLEGVSVESFSFWVAEGTTWVVEVGFTLEGDAASLASALPPGWEGLGAIRLAVRHRVFDLDLPAVTP